ncbi:MAG TPA: TolC family protein [Nannocystis sp.]|jgi:cobalt-zinc-cadmium efflux system outer membrane protein
MPLRLHSITDKKPRAYRCSALLGFVLTLLIRTGAQAAPTTAVDEPTVVRRALARNAVSDIIEGDIEAARATAVELRTWQNPELAYTREQTYGTAGTGEDYLWLAQTFDIGGRRSLRGRAAMLRSEGAAARGESLKVLLAAEVRLRYHEVLYRRLRVEALTLWSQRLSTALTAIAAREKAGDVARYDRRRLDRELALARAREEVEATALVKAWARLAALAELDAAAPQSVPGALLPATRPEAVDQYLARAATRPDIRALERAEAATELDYKAAARARVPELTLGAGWKGVQYTGLRSDGFVVNASMTLPVVDRGQGPRRRAEAEGLALRGRASLARQELAGEILGLRAEADRLHVLADQFTRERRRDADDLMRIADAAYRGGELGILELLDAFRGAVDDELQGLELALMARRARIELERAAGGGLP